MKKLVTGSLICGLLASTPLLLGAQTRGGSGYLLRRPPAALSLRIGVNQPSASSDVFRSFHKDLTLGNRDYFGAAYALDLSIPVSPHADVLLSAGVSGRRSYSEFRDYVDNDDLPIEQSTAFYRVPLSVGLKWNLVPSGRKVGQLAWVPQRFVPYLSAGAGVSHYSLRQNGDFIDFNTLRVFPSALSASGWGGLVYASAGATIGINSWVGYTTEVRYDRSEAPLRGDYQGFSAISLSGVGLTTGFTFRF